MSHTLGSLFGYYRSSSAYRVRIALHYKGLEVESLAVNLRSGAQHDKQYRALNPQGLVPLLVLAASESRSSLTPSPLSSEAKPNNTEHRLSQSLAIIEYLEDTHPSPPLLPSEPLARAQVRALSQQLAIDIQPLNNLRVLQYLQHNLGLDDEQKQRWYQHWIDEGFSSIEQSLQQSHEQHVGRYCCGDAVSLADVCLVPQVYNAMRFACDLSHYPRIQAIYKTCNQRVDFQRAAPEQQADAPVLN